MATKTLYVDGVAVAVYSPGGGGTPFPSSIGSATTSTQFYLGRDQGNEALTSIPAVFMGGSISDLRVYNHLLSAADVAAHAANPVGADGLAVWGNIATTGNFGTTSKWDTGVVPGSNTAILVNDPYLANPMDLNGGTYTVDGVTMLAGTIQDTAVTKGSLNSTSVIDVRGGTISANIGGTGGLIKTTTLPLILSGANSFSGGVTVNNGYLYLGSNNALVPLQMY